MLTSASFLLAVYGFVVSWTYLRFYKAVFPDLDASQTSNLRGDASETFAFAEFFPGPARPFVAGISEQVFNILVAMRLCVPFSAADVSAARGDHNHGHHGFSHRGAAPGSARAEAERRRALALKALDQRLHAATANAAARAASNAPPPAVAQPIPSATGPTVQKQPQVGAQQTMKAPTSASGEMLGETHYNPDGDSDRNGH